MGHSLARSAFGFGVARFTLGLGEAGNFPAAIKTVAEWFPKKERAFATGLFNSGSNVGAILAPLSVPFIAVNYGWQWAFIITGALGFIWLGFWLAVYRKPEEHPKLSKSELAYIQSDNEPPLPKIPWARLLPHKQTWAFAIGKFMTDPIWWVYLFWLPKFLNTKFGLNILQLGLPLIVIYVIADFGSIGGGWLSSRLIKSGWTVNAARKTTMLICAVLVIPIVYASITDNLWVSVILIGIAGGGASRLVGEYLYICLGYVPKTSCRFSRRHRRNGWLNRRNDYRQHGRFDSRIHAFILFGFYYCRFSLSDGIIDNAPACAETRTRAAWRSLDTMRKPARSKGVCD